MNTSENYTAQWLKNIGIANLNHLQLAAHAALEADPRQIILSPTGSGKTLAFLVPLFLSLKPEIKTVQAMVLVPSRELALQIEDVCKRMQTGFKILACYGGHKREIEENSFAEPPAVIIGTAGRMADHVRRNNFDTKTVSFLVLDEFDKMLELGFVDEMQFILQSLPNLTHRMLTSATQEIVIPEFAGMQGASKIDFLDENALAADVLRIHAIRSGDKDKLETLFLFLCFARDTSSIVFCNHRDAVQRVSDYLNEAGIFNVFYHGGMEQRDRELALTKFKNGTSNILITTDLASRGLDIANIRNIVHYHIPADEASFTHRNGRTARMGNTGNVYVIYAYDETLPKFILEVADEFELPEENNLPEKPVWSTFFIDAGKKDKISKGDIVGFLSQKGNLKKDDIGLVEVKDFMAFAAVRKSKASVVIENIKEEKLKGRKIKIAIAR